MEKKRKKNQDSKKGKKQIETDSQGNDVKKETKAIVLNNTKWHFKTDVIKINTKIESTAKEETDTGLVENRATDSLEPKAKMALTTKILIVVFAVLMLVIIFAKNLGIEGFP